MDHDGRKELLKKAKNELLIREKFYKKSPEAIHSYLKFIQLTDQEDKDWIEPSQKEIEELVKERNEKTE